MLVRFASEPREIWNIDGFDKIGTIQVNKDDRYLSWYGGDNVPNPRDLGYTYYMIYGEKFAPSAGEDASITRVVAIKCYEYLLKNDKGKIDYVKNETEIDNICTQICMAKAEGKEYVEINDLHLVNTKKLFGTVD